MKTRSFKSPLAPYIEGFLAQKISDGYAYESEALALEAFDRLFLDSDFSGDTITRDVFMAWAMQRENENLSTRSRRVTVLRQLALYTKALGKDAYLSHDRFSASKGVVHVLSAQELTAFFQIVDTCFNECPAHYHYSLGYRLLFRLYYCCGMRLAGGAYLAKKDVDLDSGRIMILRSKGDKDRAVYMADDLTDLCGDYLDTMDGLIPGTPWVFPGKDPSKPVLKHSVCRRFRRFRQRTPNAAACDRRPTPHSLRHTFVVDKMNGWMLEGGDLGSMMPYLSAYLGHITPDETFYYYRQVNKAFAVIKEKDVSSGLVIPEAASHEDL